MNQINSTQQTTLQPTYFIGIDVSKNSFCLAVKNHNFIISNKNLPMSKDGFDQLLQLLNNFKDSSIIAMEHSGIYHINLYNFLKLNSFNTIILNPYLLYHFNKFINPKPTKTDKIDAKNICNFLQLNLYNLQPTSIQHNFNLLHQLKFLQRQLETLSQNISKTKTEIKRLLQLLFPELERHTNIFNLNILNMLLIFPSAYRIKSTPKDIFIKQLTQIKPSKGRTPKINYQNIYNLSLNSIASYYPLMEDILVFKIKMLLSLQQHRDYIAESFLKIAQQIFSNEIYILTSIKGISKLLAACFISEIISVKRFLSYKKLIGYCGYDPVIKQSGNFKAYFKLSKKGNHHLRRLLWIMATSTIKHSHFFRDYFNRKLSQGKPYKYAVVCVATKLLKVIFTLLNQNRTFIDQLIS